MVMSHRIGFLRKKWRLERCVKQNFVGLCPLEMFLKALALWPKLPVRAARLTPRWKSPWPFTLMENRLIPPGMVMGAAVTLKDNSEAGISAPFPLLGRAKNETD